MDLEKLKKKLKAYGADINIIEARFVGDMDFYYECLQNFVKDVSYDELGKLIKEKNYKKAFETAHSIKGVAGNMGLPAIYEAICVIVETLRGVAKNGEEVRKGVLESQYKKIMSEYKNIKKLV